MNLLDIHESTLLNLLILNSSIRAKKEHIEKLKKDMSGIHAGEIKLYQDMVQTAQYRFDMCLRELGLSCGVFSHSVELPEPLKSEYEQRERSMA